jgi:hypothetical protein
MLMWARDHVSCSDSGPEFEDPILFCTDDDDGDDAECILFGDLFCHVCPVHTAQKAGSLSLSLVTYVVMAMTSGGDISSLFMQ